MRLSHRLAIENKNIHSDMIEVSEYPDLAQKYQVYGVPLTVINETLRFEGGAPEVHFVPALMSKLGITAPQESAQATDTGT